MPLSSAILLLAICINALLGIVVYLQSPKGYSTRSFFVIVLSTFLWAAPLFFYAYTDIPSIALSLSKVSYFAAGLSSLSLISFSINFGLPDLDRRKINRLRIVYVAIGALLVGVCASPYLLAGFSVFGAERVIAFGPLYLPYAVFILLSFIAGFSILYVQYKKEKDIVRQKQFQFIFAGILITVAGGLITNMVLPSFGDFSFYWLGPIFSLVMAGCFTLSIIRYHLFNTKVIATELLVFSLWIFIFIKALISQQREELVSNLILLLLVIVIGIFLIRSVIREVEQRERIEKLALELEKANERLTDLDREKSEFVSFANHQLRAPLAAMKGYASLLLEGDMGTIPDEAKQGVSRIFDSTNTLIAIVDDYMNVSRIELGSMKYAFDTIDLKHLIEDVMGELKPNIDKTKLAFTFTAEDEGTDYRITADRDKLKQVIANLIDNSLKYTPSGSVAVTLSLDRSRHRFVLMIKDTGIGIAPEVLPHLFAKWSRAGNANKVNIKGTGLGLYVAKEIVAAHHGEIRAESEGEGKGSSFIVEFEPLAKA